MDYFLKIYWNQNSTQPFNVVENLDNIKIEQDLKNFSTMTLTIPIIVSWLMQFERVELCTSNWTTDKIEFLWYIYEISPDIGKIKLTCKDYKAILSKKIILSTKIYSWQTVSAIMADILGDWQTETGEVRTFSTNYTWVVTKDFSEGDNIYDILDEIADLTNCVWNCDGKTIIFNQIVWTDRSNPASSDFFELIYNGYDFSENNIDTISVKSFGTLSNFIIWTGTTWTRYTAKDTTSINTIWCFAEFKKFREWDLTNQTQKYLDLKKWEQKIFEISPVKNLWIELNLWDKLHLRIESLNEYMNIETDVFVIKKEISVENGTKIMTLSVSQIYAEMDSFTKRLNDIWKELNLLSL